MRLSAHAALLVTRNSRGDSSAARVVPDASTHSMAASTAPPPRVNHQGHLVGAATSRSRAARASAGASRVATIRTVSRSSAVSSTRSRVSSDPRTISMTTGARRGGAYCTCNERPEMSTSRFCMPHVAVTATTAVWMSRVDDPARNSSRPRCRTKRSISAACASSKSRGGGKVTFSYAVPYSRSSSVPSFCRSRSNRACRACARDRTRDRARRIRSPLARIDRNTAPRSSLSRRGRHRRRERLREYVRFAGHTTSAIVASTITASEVTTSAITTSPSRRHSSAQAPPHVPSPATGGRAAGRRGRTPWPRRPSRRPRPCRGDPPRGRSS